MRTCMMAVEGINGNGKEAEEHAQGKGTKAGG